MNEQDFFSWFMVAWIAIATIVFVSLFFVTAPYGKFTRSGWGPTMGRTAGWMIMESPAVLLMIAFFAVGNRLHNPVAIAFLVLWQIHYVHRTYVFPLRMRGDKKHITMITVLLAIAFNIGNAYLNGRYLFTLSLPRTSSWFLDPRFLVGTALFFVGLGVNLHSDAVLRSLRKPGETGYKIPVGGMFKYVTQANYFGELVEWIGWAILTWSPAALVFVIWTAANLIPRAHATHRWYLNRFPDYPKNRKAVIPFLF